MALGFGASVILTDPDLLGVTTTAFKESGRGLRDSATIPSRPNGFSESVSVFLWSGFLQSVQSGLHSVGEFGSQLFSSEVLTLETGKLFCERIISEHFDPVFKVAPSQMELE